MSKRLDVIANVVSIVVGLLICATIGFRFVWHNQTPAAPYPSGHHIEEFDGVRFGEARRTVLIFGRSTCPYCTNSMTFYRSLIDSLSRGDVKVVFASLETTDISRRYLAEHRVHPDAVLQVKAQDVSRVNGTPTVIVVDSRGRVVRSWAGQLGADEERDVISALR